MPFVSIKFSTLSLVLHSMNKFLKFLLYFVLGIAAFVVILGLFAKKHYHIERSVEINAPLTEVHDFVRSFTNFNQWSPWQTLDPDMKTLISGPDGQVGANYAWQGNDKVGKGEQKITAITPDRIDMQVKFEEPFESESPVFLAFKENNGKTIVTWGMDMHPPFPLNGFMMFTDVDKAIGKDYENGLANLKRVSEEKAHKTYKGYAIDMAETSPLQYFLGVRKTVSFAEVPAFMAENMPKLIKHIKENNGEIAGASSGLFWNYDESAGTTDMAAAIPIKKAVKTASGFEIFTVGGGQKLTINYFGDYSKSGAAHFAMDDYMAENELQSLAPVIEEYVTDPAMEKDTAKWLTKVMYYTEPKK